MKRLLVFLVISNVYFVMARLPQIIEQQIEQQDRQLFELLPESDRALFEQARESYHGFLEEVKTVGAQYKNILLQDAHEKIFGSMECLQPSIEKSCACLKEVVTEFDRKKALLPFGDALRHAYIAAIRELEGYSATLNTFASLKQNVASSIINTQSLFIVISYVFGIYENIFKFYQKDHKDYWWPGQLFDKGLRGALAVWFFFLQKAEISTELLSENIQGKSSLGPLSKFELLAAIPAAFGVFVNPSPLSKRAHNVMNGFGKMASAMIYYQLFNTSCNKEHMSKDIASAFYETQRALFYDFYQYTRMNFHPKMIEDVQWATMGIIKPEILGAAFETLLPLRFFVDKKFESIDSYSKHGNIGANYIEFRIISYICSSIGQHWGYFFAHKYQNKFCYVALKGADKTLSLCAKIGLISKETADKIKEYKDAFGGQIEELVIELKKLLKSAFVSGSYERAMFISVLKLRGDITSGDDHASIEVTQKMLFFIVTQLADMSLISYLTATDIQHEFNENNNNIDNIVDKLIDVVHGNIIAALGGWVGFKVAPFIGRLIMRAHGPFNSVNSVATI